MRLASHSVLVALLALAFLTPAAATQQYSSALTPLPVFEFHSGFWINLHHALYFEAKQREAPAPVADKANSGQQPKLKMKESPTPLTPAERAAWDAAVSYYAANYASKDLLFSLELMQLKNQLEDFEDCDDLSGKRRKTCDADLPAPLTKVLEAVAPVYRAHFWPDHDRANRRWVARVAPLVEEQGVGISQRLADIYQTKWPREKIRVDVCAYANWAGAYTTLEPLRVTISSTDPRNQDDGALEVVFHEASHGIAEPLQNAIARECHQRDKAIPRDLWHALIFYTTGEVIRPILSASNKTGPDKPAPGGSKPDRPPGAGEGYTPYAIREGLYERGWNEYLQLLTKFWQPYLDNKITFDDAIAHIVSSL
jgi:hypothetical protein